MSDTQTVRFYGRPGQTRTLKVETDGVMVVIEVGLTTNDGRRVTRIDKVVDNEQRGGDATGAMWDLADDGIRVIRREPDADTATGRPKGIEYWSLVTTGPTEDGDLEHISMSVARGDAHGEYVYGYADEEGER
jgi:hypothetical protein